MAIVMMLNPANSISDIEGYKLYAEALVGGNGDPYGVPGYDLGTSSSNNSCGYVTWDGAESTNFETGQVAFNMDANLGTGSQTLAVTGGSDSPLTFATDGSGTVGSVELRAAAQTAGQVNWSDVTIGFYQGNTLEESVSAGQGPQVDTTGSDSSGTEQQIMVVTPDSTEDDHVIVSGTINMSTPDGTIPGPDDLFSQVFVMPPAAAPALVASPVINGDNPNGLYTAPGQPFNGAQRSMVEDAVYTFNEPVTIPNANQAFTVTAENNSGGVAPTNLIASAVANPSTGIVDGTVWAVSLTGQADGVLASIANGEYTITINPSFVFAAADGTTSMAADTGRSDNFYRLFGDMGQTEVITALDNALFKTALSAYNAAFDDTGNGVAIVAIDNAYFKQAMSIDFLGDGFMLTI